MHTLDFKLLGRGYTELVDESDIVTGDIYAHEDHVVMFSRIDLNNIDNSMILEAQGRSLSEGGRIVKENYYYQRKNEGGYVLRRLLRN